MLLLNVIMKSLNFNDYFEVSLSHNLIIKSTTYNSRDFIFINSIISIIRKLSVCKSIIVIILSLNNKQVSNINDVIFNFFI